MILVVDYDPERQKALRLAHDSDVQSISKAKIIETDPKVEHYTIEAKKKGIKNAPIKNLKVTYPDGSILENEYPWRTLNYEQED